MWLELYFCIANCNILLERLEEVGPDFFEDERTYYILHGEARALRAFFHFDLLRLFAPYDFSSEAKPAIPYVKEARPAIAPQLTPAKFVEYALEDVNAAIV